MQLPKDGKVKQDRESNGMKVQEGTSETMVECALTSEEEEMHTIPMLSGGVATTVSTKNGQLIKLEPDSSHNQLPMMSSSKLDQECQATKPFTTTGSTLVMSNID